MSKLSPWNELKRKLRPQQLRKLAEANPDGFLEQVTTAWINYRWQSEEDFYASLGVGQGTVPIEKDEIRRMVLTRVQKYVSEYGLRFDDEAIEEKVRIEVERKSWRSKRSR